MRRREFIALLGVSGRVAGRGARSKQLYVPRGHP